ncbi:DUF4280 domain-containing protein [Cellulomonas sp. HZM]|uniref:DUF4280 domain-containing protein n=1 Tax=Cellulomonas sp. HZM TaxID=1454010 RepID=UPI000493278D|nr:DUF4280 domain-containing protein [Cellulomonas sp. HZM]
MGKPAATATAMMTCSFGAAPASLVVIPATVLIEGKPAATVTDAAPMLNIPSFGMCMSLANPQVAAATAAALGVLVPMPCLPATTPWVNGATQTTIEGRPALTFGATCQCAYGGVVQILNPGSTTTLEG